MWNIYDDDDDSDDDNHNHNHNDDDDDDAAITYYCTYVSLKYALFPHHFQHETRFDN